MTRQIKAMQLDLLEIRRIAASWKPAFCCRVVPGRFRMQRLAPNHVPHGDIGKIRDGSSAILEVLACSRVDEARLARELVRRSHFAHHYNRERAVSLVDSGLLTKRGVARSIS